MTTKPKTQKPPTPKTISEMDLLLSMLTQLLLAKKSLLVEQDFALNDVRTRYAPKLALCEAEAKPLARAIEKWAKVNPAVFGAKRSLEGTHATIGWRLGQPRFERVGEQDDDARIELMRQNGMAAYIREKPAINLEALLADRASLDPDLLQDLGLEVKQTERFFIEPKEEGAAASPAAATKAGAA